MSQRGTLAGLFGGLVLGGIGGSLLAKRAVAAPPDIADEVSHISAFSISPDGEAFELEVKPILAYTHIADIPAILYALTSSGTARQVGAEQDNPEAVMSVWFDERGAVFDFGHQSGWDVVVLYDGEEIARLAGLTRAWVHPA